MSSGTGLQFRNPFSARPTRDDGDLPSRQGQHSQLQGRHMSTGGYNLPPQSFSPHQQPDSVPHPGAGPARMKDGMGVGAGGGGTERPNAGLNLGTGVSGSGGPDRVAGGVDPVLTGREGSQFSSNMPDLPLSSSPTAGPTDDEAIMGGQSGYDRAQQSSQTEMLISNRDRRLSREWDASQVPPSQFQRRRGSIFATPGSRDGHVAGSDRDRAYHDKLKEKGWLRKNSQGSR